MANRNKTTLSGTDHHQSSAPAGLLDCCESFRRQIEAIAAKCDRAPWSVYEYWKLYTRQCDMADQSPVVSEFCNWYASDLEPSVPAHVLIDAAHAAK